MTALLFNTVEFWLFFAVLYLLYLGLRHQWQNYMLLVASYLFYASWDWRFLSLILVSTIVDYVVGLRMDRSRDARVRRQYLWVSVVVNLGILGFFKYFHFFSDSLHDVLDVVGWQVGWVTLSVVLPVGISFYTFQTMSYTIDIYRGKLRPTRRFLDFALFVAFFPQLVAGPIERAKRLLPQVLESRQLSDVKVVEGSYLIAWGLFKKMVIADSLATIVDPVFALGGPYNGVEVLVALYAFAWQIYCDFSGYTDIARGLGKLLGFELMLNFNLPYLATNPRDFWQRWHISLSTWLKDYLYIPLGGNRLGRWMTLRNLAVTMLLGGLWHGAAWTFVAWGGYHALLLVGHRLASPYMLKMWWVVRVVLFWHLVVLGWLLFRAQSMVQVKEMLAALLFSFEASASASNMAWYLAFLVAALLFTQLNQYWRRDLLFVLKLPRLNQAIYAMTLVFVTVYVLLSKNPPEAGEEFIYFQF